MSYFQLPYVHWSIAVLGLACLGTAACYSLLTLTAVLLWRLRRPTLHPRIMPPVTLLKPLCGAEHGLYERLRTFCQQNYREFQIVFGVRDPTDPALVVQRLRQEFPSLPIDVVATPQLHGSNYKISNLINMVARARHDVLIIADSDTFVGPDYLRSVTAPLLDRSVGLVTCPYRDVPTARVWSRLGAMYINEWYMPSVLLAWLFGGGCYASGQTLCLRRQTLEAIGGFQAMTNHLADDYRMGELIRGTGLKIVLSPTVVLAEHDEPDLEALTRHELRWMRTIRMLRPRSFRMIFLTFSLPMAIVGFALSAAAERARIQDMLKPTADDSVASHRIDGEVAKLVLAREIDSGPRILIVGQPTRGVDVSAIAFIHGELLRERERGHGILLVSAELSEILALADRILVMYEGRIVAEFARADADETTLGLYMAGGTRA